ncbi:MAG: hypothetical protein WHS46_12240 [Desulfosoma sp.]
MSEEGKCLRKARGRLAETENKEGQGISRRLIRLKGDDFDLEKLGRELSGNSIVRVFRHDKHHYLEVLHKAFETARQIYDYAKDVLVPAINGIMRVRYPGFRNVEVDAIGEEKEDGRINHCFFVETSGELGVRSELVASVVTDNETVVHHIFESIAGVGERWLEVLLKEEGCLNAFRLYAARPYDWVTLYKIFEIVESDGAPITNWVSKNQVKRFTRTANSPKAVGLEKARHGKERPSSSESSFKPMSIQEATRLIGIILERWLEQKVSQCGSIA